MNKKFLNISVISILYDFQSTCIDSYNSLYSQKKINFEHLLIYKKLAPDKKKILINKFPNIRLIQEKDEQYQNKFTALNQGIKESTNEVIFMQHADDKLIDRNYLNDALEKINCGYDFVFSDINLIRENQKIVRKWVTSEKFNKFSFYNIPPHISLVYKKEIHDQIGFYNPSYPIASDFDFMIRLINNENFKFYKLNTISINMLLGGDSTKYNNLIKVFKEDYRIFKHNNFNFNLMRTILKKLNKIFQYIT